MTIIRLRFPASRYHATPWGRHVNEGVAEWPPSPYRLLRALFDVWQRKCAHLREQEVNDVLEALASAPPRYALPSVSAAHTRSYLSSNGMDPTEKALVFDGFVALPRGAHCDAAWPELELSERQSAVLSELLTNMNYLGRSESWVEAELVDEFTQGIPCEPLEVAAYPGEPVPVACSVPATEYRGKKSWLEALTMSTTDLLKAKASSPPLLRQVRYVRPEDAVLTDPQPGPRRAEPRVKAVLLGLDATVLPLATATIEIAEQIRTRLMGAHKKLVGEGHVSALFSGKAPDGTKRLDHGHLYILPLTSEDARPARLGRIDRVLLRSPLRPFHADELDAVRGVRELWQEKSRPAVRCVITWQGERIQDSPGKLATVVQSASPFVTTRHWRPGRDFARFLEDEVRRECTNHSIPGVVEQIEPIEDMPGPFHCIEFRRNRREDRPRPGYAFRIRFRDPVVTPFSLGYGAHFGLGQFVACNE